MYLILKDHQDKGGAVTFYYNVIFNAQDAPKLSYGV